MLKTATREDIDKLPKRRFVYVPITGGLRVRLRSLSELEKSEYEGSIMSKRGGINIDKLLYSRQRLIALTAVDEDGKLLYDPDGDLTKLNGLDGLVSVIVWDKARAHCGFEDGDIEELVKNSNAIPESNSPTNSPDI